MTVANNLDPDEAPQDLRSHLRSKLSDIVKKYRSHSYSCDRNIDFLQILKKEKMERVDVFVFVLTVSKPVPYDLEMEQYCLSKLCL